VRSFKPHVIIAVFTGTPRDGHGQHQAAGILAREAYDLSGDTSRLPRSATAGHGPWTVSKFYRGTFFQRDNATLTFNVGAFDPLLGRSYAEIAAISRSQHRSQAFGTLQPLGVRFDAVQREASRAPAPPDARAERSIFDGIDTTWARLRQDVTSADGRAALDSLPAAFGAVRTGFNPFEPERSIPALGRVKALLNRICPTTASGPPCPARTGNFSEITDAGLTVALAMGRLSDALVLATGVVVEATVPRELWSVGERIPVRPVLFNRGKRAVTILGARMRVDSAFSEAGGSREVVVQPDSSAPYDIIDDRLGGRFLAPTAPHWLARPRRGAMFDYIVFGLDEASYASVASVALQL